MRGKQRARHPVGSARHCLESAHSRSNSPFQAILWFGLALSVTVALLISLCNHSHCKPVRNTTESAAQRKSPTNPLRARLDVLKRPKWHPSWPPTMRRIQAPWALWTNVFLASLKTQKPATKRIRAVYRIHGRLFHLFWPPKRPYVPILDPERAPLDLPKSPKLYPSLGPPQSHYATTLVANLCRVCFQWGTVWSGFVAYVLDRCVSAKL